MVELRLVDCSGQKLLLKPEWLANDFFDIKQRWHYIFPCCACKIHTGGRECLRRYTDIRTK